MGNAESIAGVEGGLALKGDGCSLDPLFHPQGVLLVGASQDPTKLGYGVARNLVQSGYVGAIHFVNPRGGTLFDRPIYPDMASVPDPVDLAVLIVPAPSVPDALRACGARGLRAARVLDSRIWSVLGIELPELDDFRWFCRRRACSRTRGRR